MCGRPGPGAEATVLCNLPAGHEGPHRGDVNAMEVIFWTNGRPRRPLVRLRRERDGGWVMVEVSRWQATQGA